MHVCRPKPYRLLPAGGFPFRWTVHFTGTTAVSPWTGTPDPFRVFLRSREEATCPSGLCHHGLITASIFAKQNSKGPLGVRGHRTGRGGGWCAVPYAFFAAAAVEEKRLVRAGLDGCVHVDAGLLAARPFASGPVVGKHGMTSFGRPHLQDE
jgi:hypothetical protein